MADPLPKYARVNAQDPQAWGQCDRCGFWRNRADLVSQMAWAGTHLYDTGTLVCGDRCYDIPNEQLRTIILPPDPQPVLNARVPNLQYEEAGPVQTNLAENVEAFSALLPVESVEGFEIGNTVWVQLSNATFAQCEIIALDAVSSPNTMTVDPPILASAPYTGVVTILAENT
ncbi:MAG TPA: hypothetical protein VHC20_03390 [Candidatus Paceibacterota bacterium]|nr:hypothetical protein [Candidatus Paceibacterota bacterium]